MRVPGVSQGRLVIQPLQLRQLGRLEIEKLAANGFGLNHRDTPSVGDGWSVPGVATGCVGIGLRCAGLAP